MKYELYHQKLGDKTLQNRKGRPAPQGWYAVFSDCEVDDGDGNYGPLILGPFSSKRHATQAAQNEIAERWPPISQQEVGEMLAQIIEKIQGRWSPRQLRGEDRREAINIVRRVAKVYDITIPEP